MTKDDVDDDDAFEQGDDDDDVFVEILCWLQIWFWEAAAKPDSTSDTFDDHNLQDPCFKFKLNILILKLNWNLKPYSTSDTLDDHNRHCHHQKTLIQALSFNIWKHTVEKSQTNATKMHTLEQTPSGYIYEEKHNCANLIWSNLCLMRILKVEALEQIFEELIFHHTLSIECTAGMTPS